MFIGGSSETAEPLIVLAAAKSGWELSENEINDFLTKSKNLPPSAMIPFLQLKRSTICTLRSNRTKADVHYELTGNCLRARLQGP